MREIYKDFTIRTIINGFKTTSEHYNFNMREEGKRYNLKMISFHNELKINNKHLRIEIEFPFPENEEISDDLLDLIKVIFLERFLIFINKEGYESGEVFYKDSILLPSHEYDFKRSGIKEIYGSCYNYHGDDDYKGIDSLIKNIGNKIKEKGLKLELKKIFHISENNLFKIKELKKKFLQREEIFEEGIEKFDILEKNKTTSIDDLFNTIFGSGDYFFYKNYLFKEKPKRFFININKEVNNLIDHIFFEDGGIHLESDIHLKRLLLVLEHTKIKNLFEKDEGFN